MAAGKTTRRAKPAARSGPNIPDSQRHTRKVTVRVDPELEARWRAVASARGSTLGEVVEDGLDALESLGDEDEDG